MDRGDSPPPGRRWLRIVGTGATLVLALVAAIAAGGWVWLATSLPPTRETVTTAAVMGQVSVRRDRLGVPHIRAENLTDAVFALGYVHAQDRLWQMETMRRLGAGRLSEVFGAKTLDVDIYMRTLGLAALAERQAAALSPELAAVFEAYARGVNQWRDHHGGVLPPEFVLIRHSPEAWTTADSLLWFKLMAVQLAQNRRSEALRVDLKDRLTEEQFRALWPNSDVDGGADGGNRGALAHVDVADGAGGVALPEWPRLAGASNAWVVGAGLSGTGKPILANDLHLPLRVPIQWYLARIDLPDGIRAGATAPGFPLFVVGHNGRVAWGMTSGEADIEDLFVEDLDADGETYAGPEGPLPLTTREETIRVRGAESRTITVRSTRHGPMLPDPLPVGEPEDAGNAPEDESAGRDALSLQATYLAEADTTPEAVYRLNGADTVDAVLAAAPLYHTPPVNLFVADTEGAMAQMLVGAVPRRRGGGRMLPAAGGTEDGDWIGRVDVQAQRSDAAGQPAFMLNANNRPDGIDTSEYIGDGWATGLRAGRLRALLTDGPPATLNGTQTVQLDQVSLAARHLLPRLIATLAPESQDSPAVRRLRLWSGTMDRERPEPLIFVAWLRELDRRIFADEVGTLFRWLWVFRPDRLEEVLETRSVWCDDVTTEETESCADQVRVAFDAAMGGLTAAHGDDVDAWRWGEVHVARFHHPLLDAIPVLGRLVGLAIETGGGGDTINRGGIPYGDEPAPFEHIHGPGVRAVYDLADLSRSRFIIATGQSGNPLSRHYGDMLTLWRNGGWIRLDRPMQDVERDGGGRIDILPK
jgi:penicillin amidase